MDNKTLKAQLLKAASAVEDEIDAQIIEMDKLDREGLQKLRESRLEEMKREMKEKMEWKTAGHGTFQEVTEGEIFSIVKRSKNVVALFFDPQIEEDSQVENLLKRTAGDHLETRFVKLNALRCTFLVDRLGLKIFPIIILIKEGLTIGKFGPPLFKTASNLIACLEKLGVICEGAIDEGLEENLCRERRNRIKWLSGLGGLGNLRTIRQSNFNNESDSMED